MSDSGKLVHLEQTPPKNFKMLATSSTRLTTYSPIHNKQTYTSGSQNQLIVHNLHLFESQPGPCCSKAD